MVVIPQNDELRVGVDIGGTFTDCVVLSETGARLTVKSLTTPDNPAQGVIDCLHLVATQLAVPLADVLGRTPRSCTARPWAQTPWRNAAVPAPGC